MPCNKQCGSALRVKSKQTWLANQYSKEGKQMKGRLERLARLMMLHYVCRERKKERNGWQGREAANAGFPYTNRIVYGVLTCYRMFD